MSKLLDADERPNSRAQRRADAVKDSFVSAQENPNRTVSEGLGEEASGNNSPTGCESQATSGSPTPNV
jgi:hypothetical protein